MKEERFEHLKVYLKHYVSKMSDADGECSETMVWLSFSKDCEFLSEELSEQLRGECQEIGRMLGFMMTRPAEFGVKSD
jgi:four helix bundle protein